MKPRRPYLLRALHEWISDSGETPHIVVDAAAEGVTVPRQYVKDGKIVLNVSFSATQMLKLGNDFVSFEARFGGVGFAVQVPVRAILGIYARETGQGMIFPEGDADPDPTDSPPAAPGTGKPSAPRRSGRNCRWSNSSARCRLASIGAKSVFDPVDPMRPVRQPFDRQHVEPHRQAFPMLLTPQKKLSGANDLALLVPGD